ncbi:MAG: hypothetical protein ACTHM8_11205 [Sphingomonas sp.]
MKNTTRPGLAIAAIFPAAMVPIALAVMQSEGASDFVRGSIVGILLGAALLLLGLALRPRRA